MLPSPPASFSSCARRFMMDFSYTCMKHTVNYFLASSIITKSADYCSSFRSSRCLRLETFTCMSLAENNKFIIFSLHTPAVPRFHVFRIRRVEICALDQLWKCGVCIWRYVRVWRWLKKELMLILLGALAQSSVRCCSTHFPLLWINRTQKWIDVNPDRLFF